MHVALAIAIARGASIAHVLDHRTHAHHSVAIECGVLVLVLERSVLVPVLELIMVMGTHTHRDMATDAPWF